MNKKFYIGIFGILIGIAGIASLWYGDGFYDAIGVFLMLWSNNIDNRIK